VYKTENKKVSGFVVLYPVYTIKQSSSKRPANIERLEHTSCSCILNAFARCLLDRVNGV